MDESSCIEHSESRYASLRKGCRFSLAVWLNTGKSDTVARHDFCAECGRRGRFTGVVAISLQEHQRAGLNDVYCAQYSVARLSEWTRYVLLIPTDIIDCHCEVGGHEVRKPV